MARKFDRREFLKILGSAAGYSLLTPRFSFANISPNTGRNFISIHFDGGIDSLAAFQPTAASSFKTALSSARPLLWAPDIDVRDVLNGERGAHKSLDPIMPEFQNGKAVLLRNATFMNQSMSHQLARQAIYNAGRGESPADSRKGLFATIKDYYNFDLSQVVGFNAMPGEVGLNCDNACPKLSSLSSFNYLNRSGWGTPNDSELAFDGQLARETFSGMMLDLPGGTQNKAFQAIRSGTVSMEAAIAMFGAANAEAVSTYPATFFGNLLRDLAKYMKWRSKQSGSDVMGGLYELSRGGFDSHSKQNTDLLGARLPEFSAALAVFISDLKLNNLFDNTTILVWGEFGRTPQQNSIDPVLVGTDHARAGDMLLFGGKVKGGAGGTTNALRVRGSEGTAAEVTQNWIQAKIEFPNVMREILLWLGFSTYDIENVLIPERPTQVQNLDLFL